MAEADVEDTLAFLANDRDRSFAIVSCSELADRFVGRDRAKALAICRRGAGTRRALGEDGQRAAALAAAGAVMSAWDEPRRPQTD